MRKKLDLSEDERRLYNNQKHREQERKRREKAERQALKEIVCEITMTFENLGWTKTDLLVGADEEMIDRVVDELLAKDCFKIVLGSKKGVKIKEKE